MTKPWARHYQDGWQEKSADHNLPAWLRTCALAYGLHKANGHAMFSPGGLALALGKPDPTTGELIPEPNPGRAVRNAVTYGWLAKGSNTRCLIVPAHHIDGGLGNPNAPCPMHGAK